MKCGIKKIFFSLSLMLCLSLSLTACNLNPSPYNFMHGIDEMQEIQIVHIELAKDQEFYAYMIDDCKILADIEDISEFIEKFNNDVLFERYLFGDPTHLGHGDYAIKITYNNGDFELIGYYAQCMGYREETSDGWGPGATGFVNCNRDDFFNFINLYLDNPVQ